MTIFMRSTGRWRFVHDTLTLQLGQAVAMLVQAATGLVMLRILGPETLGTYALGFAMIAVAALFDLTAAPRVALIETTRALGAGERHRAGDALAYFLRITLTVNAALVAAFWVAAPGVASLVYGQADAGAWARWFVVPRLVDAPWGLLLVALQCRREMTTLVALESGRVVASSLLSIALLLAGWGLSGLVAAQLATSGACFVIAARAYGRLTRTDPLLPAWGPLLARMATVAMRARMHLGLLTSLDKNLAVLGGQLPVLIMGAISPAVVGYYTAALRLVTFPQPLLSGLARNLETLLPHRAGRGVTSLRSVFALTALVSGAIWSVVTLAIGIAGPTLLITLAGAEYASATPVVYPLLLQSLAAGFGVGVGAMFRTLDRLEYSIGLHVVSLALMAPLAYVLIGASGAVGGAWFHGLRSLIVTIAGIGLVLALSKSSTLSAAQAESPVETHNGAGETTSRVPARSWTAR